MDHPVKLLLNDDLERTRLTVFFRLLLAIPLLVWLWLWAIGVLLLAIPNWLVALASGTPWRPAHEFTRRFLRFSAHASAYVMLLAQPYPGFLGDRAYPVDVELPAPARQSRWSVAFRLLLALPALLLAALLTTGVWDARSADSWAQTGGLLLTVAVLGWFAALARARMPRGMRDAGAYGLLYATQAYAYVLLVTNRYPNSDPLAALPEVPAREHAITLAIGDDRVHGRLTTFFRLLLAVPHFVWLFLWGIAAYAGVVVSWFIQLIAGRPSAGLHSFLSRYLRYTAHVTSYVYLLAEPYPDFGGREGTYPVDVSIAGPQRQARLTILFRALLALPAAVLASTYAAIALLAAVFGWFVVLVRGEMPLGLRNAIALWLRYNQQTQGYVFLLTEQYPYSGPTAPGQAAEQQPPVFLPPLAA